MLHRNGKPHVATSMLVGICFTLTLVLTLTIATFFSSQIASAHSILAPAGGGPTFRVNAGFDARYRDGNWVPVQVTLRNDGADFTGTVSVNVPSPYSGIGGSPSSMYQVPISLPTGAQKQVTIYVPFYFGTQGVTQTISVDLLNANGQKVGTQTSALLTIGPGDLFVGILSDQSTGFGPLSSLSLPNQTALIRVQALNATNMPSVAAVLKNFDLIVLDNFTTSSLSQGQLAALQSWINQGGSLIVVGGPEWRHTLGPLPANLLPVTISGTDTLQAGTPLLPIGSPSKGGPDQSKVSDAVRAPVTVSTATASQGSSVILTSGTTPLMVQSRLGQGLVCYLAFDPTLDPIVGWSNAPTLWKGLLLRSLGDQLLTPSTDTGSPGRAKFTSLYNTGNVDGLLQSLLPNAFPSTWLILALLLGYVALLGPIRFLIVRRLKNRAWSWRIVLSTIVVFSLLSYGIALQQKGTSIVSDTVSIVQLHSASRASGMMAHVTTYVGVFVPSQGDFQVHVPGESLVQPSHAQYPNYQNQPTQQPTTITTASNGTDVNLQGVNTWTLRSLVSEHDQQVQGGIVSHLTLQNGNLVGTVTNTLPYSLSDVYVLMSNRYVALGHMTGGQTEQVALSIGSAAGGTGDTGSPGATLADQIATSKGALSLNGPPQNELQRHMSVLLTLSGENVSSYCGGGGPCYRPIGIRPIIYGGGVGVVRGVRVVSSNGVVYSGGGPYYPYPYQLNGRDPLVLSDAPATLIGWADTSSDGNVTINGNRSSGVQETLIQAPLDIGFSGAVDLPSNLVPGQLVDVQNQGSTAQTLVPGLYTLASGSMTFEFTLPNIPGLQVESVTITEPANLAQTVPQPASGPLLDANHLDVHIYNWKTGAWDAFPFSQYSISIQNARPYVGPGGRTIVQFATQSSSQGTVVFSKPLLNLQGTV